MSAESKVPFWVSFYRSQFASVTTTLVDFGALIFFVEVLGLWYVAATATSAFLGALTNFLMGRHWSFQVQDGKLDRQAYRYAMVSASSLILNSVGVYFFTDVVGLHYMASKTVIALMVGIFFNFPLHRRFVFR